MALQFRKEENGDGFITVRELRFEMSAPAVVDAVVAADRPLDEITDKNALAAVVDEALFKYGIEGFGMPVETGTWIAVAQHVAALLPKDRAMEITNAIVERVQAGNAAAAVTQDEPKPIEDVAVEDEEEEEVV